MSPAKMNKAESAIRGALALREAFNHNAIPSMMDLLSDDCIVESHFPGPDGLSIQGKDAISAYWRGLFTAFPDIHMDVEEVFGFGERCVLRWNLHWIGNEGNAVHLRGANIYKTRNEQICEIFSYGKCP